MSKNIPIGQAIIGTLNAFKESTDATDIVIVAVNRETGEFRLAGYPMGDHRRQLDVMNKTVERLKQEIGKRK